MSGDCSSCSLEFQHNVVLGYASLRYMIICSPRACHTGMWRSRAVAATTIEHRPSDRSWLGAWWKVDAATSARIAARRRERSVRSSACRSNCITDMICSLQCAQDAHSDMSSGGGC